MQQFAKSVENGEQTGSERSLNHPRMLPSSPRRERIRKVISCHFPFIPITVSSASSASAGSLKKKTLHFRRSVWMKNSGYRMERE